MQRLSGLSHAPPVTVLVFFAASTGTRIVSANLLFNFYGLGFHLLLCVAVCLRQQVAASLFHLRPVKPARQLRLLQNCLGFNHQVTLYEEGSNLLIYLLDHGFKEVERFKLVNQQRVLLLVTCILNRLLQVVHFAQLFFPGIVNRGQGYPFLKSK